MKNKFGFLVLSFILLFCLSFISAGTLKVTEEHPFLIDGEWIPASELQIGDELTLINGSKVAIKNIKDFEMEEAFPVYNLEAGEFHNFVVCGEEDCSNNSLGVVVHNSNDVVPLYERGFLTKLFKIDPNNPPLYARGELMADSGKKIVVLYSDMPLAPAMASSPGMNYDFNKWYDVFSANLAKKAGINRYTQDFIIMPKAALNSKKVGFMSLRALNHEIGHINEMGEVGAYFYGQSALLSGKSVKITVTYLDGITEVISYSPTAISWTKAALWEVALHPMESAGTSVQHFFRNPSDPLNFFKNSLKTQFDFTPEGKIGMGITVVGYAEWLALGTYIYVNRDQLVRIENKKDSE